MADQAVTRYRIVREGWGMYSAEQQIGPYWLYVSNTIAWTAGGAERKLVRQVTTRPQRVVKELDLPNG